MGRSFAIALLATSFAALCAAEEADILGLPSYPESAPVRIDGGLKTNNVPLSARTFRTPDDIRTVMAYYHRSLKARGLEVVSHNFGPNKGYVGYYDPASETMRLATVMADTNTGGALIILSSMNPKSLVEKPITIPADLPTVATPLQVVTNESEDARGRSRTVSFVAQGNIEKVTAELLSSAQEKGWHAARDQNAGPNALVLARGKKRCIIRMLADTASSAAVTVTMLVFE
ncbi:MAG: hypothetical protein JXR96_16835 [Deltaproteobacteria bacterium]|nr:hypothetical protein [Deltaproteobacteria bacterium]